MKMLVAATASQLLCYDDFSRYSHQIDPPVFCDCRKTTSYASPGISVSITATAFMRVFLTGTDFNRNHKISR